MLVFLATGLTGSLAAEPSLLEHLQAIEKAYAVAGEGNTPPQSLAAEIAALLHRLESNGALPSGSASVPALNHLLFDELAIRPSTDLKDPGNLLPSTILRRRQGYCVGIAALYLVLAERLQLPIHAVATPSHVFLRYDDGASRINIETQQGGAAIPDDRYIREQKIPEESIRHGVFMREMTTAELLAQIHSNLGVTYSENGDFKRAAKEYERALDLDPSLPAAFYNRANDLLQQGDLRASIRLFSRSLKLYSTDVWALNNRGLARMKLGQDEDARRDLERALELDPEFEPARNNLLRLPISH